MNALQMNRGQITHLDHERNFGLIETRDQSSSYFFQCKTPQLAESERTSAFRPQLGDDVLFKLKEKDPAPEAYDLRFVENERLPLLLNQARARLSLLGQVKKMDDGHYFIKDEQTLIWLPVQRSIWEIDSAGFYEDLVDTKVAYRLISTEDPSRLRAHLLHRRLNTRYYTLLGRLYAKAPVEAIITGAQDWHYTALLPDLHVSARIPNGPAISQLIKGDVLQVRIAAVDDWGVMATPLAD